MTGEEDDRPLEDRPRPYPASFVLGAAVPPMLLGIFLVSIWFVAAHGQGVSRGRFLMWQAFTALSIPVGVLVAGLHLLWFRGWWARLLRREQGTGGLGAFLTVVGALWTILIAYGFVRFTVR